MLRKFRRDRLAGGIWGVWLIAGLVAAGCNPRGKISVVLSPKVKRGQVSAVVFMIDGVRAARFYQLLNDGKLPNIVRYLSRRGARLTPAVASLPTSTYPNLVSMQTGRFPGQHQLIGNAWFDRQQHLFRQYTSANAYRYVNGDFTGKTIFERIEKGWTASLLCPVYRGADLVVNPLFEAGLAWYTHNTGYVDHLAAKGLESVAHEANRRGHWPKLIWVYLPGVDAAGHRFGPDSPQYEQALVNADYQVGLVCKALDANGLLETSCLALLSDHGHSSVRAGCRFDVEGFLRRGLGLSRSEAVVGISGYRCAMIWLRGESGWSERPNPNQIQNFSASHGRPERGWYRSCRLTDLLLSRPGVELIALRVGPGYVRIFSRAGEAKIIAAGKNQYLYQVTTGRDPLGFSYTRRALGLMDGKFHSGRSWRRAVAGTDYPDIIVQLPAMFDSPRCGDLVLFAREGWSFGKKPVAGGHGSVHAGDMHIPFLLAGPGISPETIIPFARNVDLPAAIISILGGKGLPPRFSPGE